MIKVITYGTYDMLHFGHINLLKRAKALGDYLIVGVTADDFDKSRGKINVQQSLMERIEAVRQTKLADEIIVEEYEGQKIDDIRKLQVDIFTVGSDWIGRFDYLNEYCQVIYLPRTEGVSSTELRNKDRALRLGLAGDTVFLNKIQKESSYVNGITIEGVYTTVPDLLSEQLKELPIVTDSLEKLLECSDAFYIRTQPQLHYEHIKMAINSGKHVLCESPIVLLKNQLEELRNIADEMCLVLMDGLKTAYSTAYRRMLYLIKEGAIGEVISVDANCSSLKSNIINTDWESLYEWAPTALLPIFDILGPNYLEKHTVIQNSNNSDRIGFLKTDFVYAKAVASIKIGDRIKTEGSLVVTGTKGYVYVPAPWWKTDYFEIRYENQTENKRFFYQLDGEGIRYELVSFIRDITYGSRMNNVDPQVSMAITSYMEDILLKKEVIFL